MSILKLITKRRNSNIFIIAISLLSSVNTFGQNAEKGIKEQQRFNHLIQADSTIEKNYIVIFDEFTEKKTTLTDREIKIVNQNLIEAVNSYNKSLKVEINKWNKKNKMIIRYFA